MAHSTATMSAAAATGEINYFYKDEHGTIHRTRKPAEIKQETGGVYVNSGSGGGGSLSSNADRMGAFNQMNSTNQTQFGRISNNYNIPIKTEDNSYTVVTPQNSGNIHESSNSKGDRYGKYTHNSMKMKPKLHTIQGTTTHTSTSSSVQRKRKPDKAGKGLRHFSMKVCEKVKEKGKTTYNEVADELVNEEIQNNQFDTNCDQKNIRRRVYDALNVLMAIRIISKDKKEIRWIGLPTNSVEQCATIEKENEERRERIRQKHQQLRELMLQQLAFKSLVERNKQAEGQGVVPTPNSSLQLPFITVNTYKTTKINCSVTNDKSEYIFKFDDKFEMHDDIEVLKRMGLLFGLDKGQCSPEDIERAKALVPKNFAKYIEAYGRGDTLCDSDDEDITKSYMQLSTNESQGYATQTTDDAKSNDLDDEDEYSDID